MKKHIPNIITLFNLLSGLIALIFVFDRNWIWAAFWVASGIFFDFFDGLFARKLSVSSQLGLQLDSLADMVTSGVVPAFAMFFLLQDASQIDVLHNFEWNTKYLLPFAGLLIALASALRLAKFNIDERQSTSFIGLPTPANALFVMSLPLIIYHSSYIVLAKFFFNPTSLILVTLILSWLLNAEIPLFSLKFKDFSWQNNREKYILITTSIIAVFVLQWAALPAVIVFYIFLSVLFNRKKL